MTTKKTYIIELSCWDGTTVIKKELSDSQIEAINSIGRLSIMRSEHGGQPTLFYSLSQGDKKCPDCEKIMEECIDSYECYECDYIISKN